MNADLLFFAFLLERCLSRPSVLTCKDVALLGHWDTGLCCPHCHAFPNSRGLLYCKDGHGHDALLCCQSYQLLNRCPHVQGHHEAFPPDWDGWRYDDEENGDGEEASDFEEIDLD